MVFGERPALQGDLSAGLLMLAAVFLYSLTPLLVVVAGGRDAPFLFSLLRRVGMALGFLGFLALWRPGFILDGEVWRRVWSGLRGRHMAGTVLAMLDMLVFVLASRLVSISVVTVLAQCTTVVFVLLMRRLDAVGFYRRLSPRGVGLLLVGLLGFGLVVMSGRGSGGLPPSLLSPALLGGVLLALLSAFLSGLNVCCFALGRLLAAGQGGPGVSGKPPGDLEFCYVLLCSVLAQLASALLHGLLALGEFLLSGRELGLGSVLLALGTALLPLSLAGVLNRRANVMTTNLGVNALSYLGPAVSVGFLALSGAAGLTPGGAEVSRPVLFALGLSVVLGVNLLVCLRRT